MDHPILYKAIDSESVNLLARTSKSKDYPQFDDRFESTLITPYKLGYKDGEDRYSSLKIYEMLLKSDKNGDALINMGNYSHFMSYYNISENDLKI